MKKLLIFLVVIIIGLLGFYFSPYSKQLLRDYVKKRMCFTDKFQITYFNYSINSFALQMKHKDNVVDLVGNFYPFSGTYEAHIKNLSFINPFLKGSITSSGTFIPNKVNGSLIIAGGIGKLNLSCNNKIKGEINLNNIDFNTFFQMVEDFNLSVWREFLKKGTANLNIHFNKSIVVNGNFNGTIQLLNKRFPATLRLLNMNIIHPNKGFVFKAYLDSKYIKGNINGKYLSDITEYKGDIKYFDLTLLRQFLLYPIVGISSLKFTYNKTYNNLFFQFNGFSGYYQDNKINIQFKEDYKKFFSVLSLKPIFSGKVSGNISIDFKKGLGNFDFLFKDSKILPSKILSLIEKITHINLHSSNNTFFVNGSFNKEIVKFEIYNKNLQYKIFVKNAVYNYKDKNLSADITISNNESLFKLRLKDGKVKVLSKRFYNPRKEIIVQ